MPLQRYRTMCHINPLINMGTKLDNLKLNFDVDELNNVCAILTVNTLRDLKSLTLTLDYKFLKLGSFRQNILNPSERIGFAELVNSAACRGVSEHKIKNSMGSKISFAELHFVPVPRCLRRGSSIFKKKRIISLIILNKTK
jgi:hypothetical protein